MDNMKRNKIFIFSIIGFVVFFVSAMIMTKVIEYNLQEDNQPKQLPRPAIKVAVAQEKPMPALLPADPKEYGMVLYSDIGKPKTQDDWNRVVQEGFAETKKNLPEETTNATATLKCDKAKFEERMKQIDERMKTYEARLKTNPQDEEAVSRIDKLRILKAVSNALKDDIVNQ